jgi:hypothetical protein
METGEEGVLVEKKPYDVRGGQGKLSRVGRFDKEAYAHMLAYRILIFLSFVFGLSIIVTAIVMPQALTSRTIKIMVLIVWVLFTAQVFATAQAASLIFSGGLSSNNLNRSFVNFAGSGNKLTGFWKAFPYIVLAVWLIAFIFLLWIWFF